MCAACFCLQRLSTENQEQQQLIYDLLARVQRLEEVMHEEELRKSRKGMFGGFFALRGLAASAS